MDYSRKEKQAEEIIYLNYKIKVEHNTTNKQTKPDYSSATAIMLVIFWTERDFCIISDSRNSLSNRKKNLETQQMHSLHLKNPLRENVKHLFVCVPFSLGSVCKYWIYVIDDIGVSQPSQICKMERFAKILNG